MNALFMSTHFQPAASFLLSLFLLVGCTTRSAYRPVSAGTHEERHTYKQGADKAEQRAIAREREHECLEKYSDSNFWLGHVEMTEYGTYQDPRQMSQLERQIEQDTHTGKSLFKNGITVVVFVHGWFNNAQEENGNLNNFRHMLSDLGAEQKQQGRGVLGVYLSWRGGSISSTPLKFLTYWGRGRTSDVIGQGMVEPLARIRNIHWLVASSAGRASAASLDIYQNSRLVFIGHSFGGRALYTAVAKSMETSFMPPYWAARSFPAAKGKGSRTQATMQRVTGVGDLVLLINPAIKSLPYRPSHYAMSSNTMVNYDSKQPVLMMVLSAKNDVPNKSLLPIGETLGNRFRDWFARPDDRKEASQNTTALGHWPLYRTHDLELMESGQFQLTKVGTYFSVTKKDKNGVKTTLPLKTLRPDLMNFADSRGNRRIVTDTGNPGLLPFMVVSTSPKIINGHSDFWLGSGSSKAYDFVKFFISAQNKAVGAARADQAAPAQSRVMPTSY